MLFAQFSAAPTIIRCLMSPLMAPTVVHCLAKLRTTPPGSAACSSERIDQMSSSQQASAFLAKGMTVAEAETTVDSEMHP
jgi:hypothetical protein